MSRVLVIPDLHEPCSRPGAITFCKELRRKYKTDTVVFIGDITDFHSISFHAQHPEMPGPSDEFELAFEAIKKWKKVFPKATVCLGNHDRRVVRLAESVNIPARFIRNYKEVWDTPNWEWIDRITIDEVVYFHGDGTGTSLYPAFNASKKIGLSCVIGHHHKASGIKWSANPLRRTFGMDVGTLIDDTSMAFAYNQRAIERSILSAGVILDGIPHHLVFPCGKGEKYWDGNF